MTSRETEVRDMAESIYWHVFHALDATDLSQGTGMLCGAIAAACAFVVEGGLQLEYDAHTGKVLADAIEAWQKANPPVAVA